MASLQLFGSYITSTSSAGRHPTWSREPIPPVETTFPWRSRQNSQLPCCNVLTQIFDPVSPSRTLRSGTEAPLTTPPTLPYFDVKPPSLSITSPLPTCFFSPSHCRQPSHRQYLLWFAYDKPECPPCIATHGRSSVPQRTGSALARKVAVPERIPPRTPR